ncbi:MAG: hypothetical protein ABIG80_04385, partial [Patescibacteria group bacterium]
FEEAFEVTKPKGKEATMSLDRNIFEIEGNIGESVAEKINKINALLVIMQAKMEDKLSSDEMKAAMLAIEHRLEGAMPTNFLKQYREAARENWGKAAEIIQTHILDDLNRFVLEKTLDTAKKKKAATELQWYIQVTDKEDWMYLDADQAEKILRKLDPKVSGEEVAVFRSRYSDDNLRYREDVFTGGKEVLARGYGSE